MRPADKVLAGRKSVKVAVVQTPPVYLDREATDGADDDAVEIQIFGLRRRRDAVGIRPGLKSAVAERLEICAGDAAVVLPPRQPLGLVHHGLAGGCGIVLLRAGGGADGLQLLQ